MVGIFVSYANRYHNHLHMFLFSTGYFLQCSACVCQEHPKEVNTPHTTAVQVMEHSISNAFVITWHYTTADTASEHSVDIYKQLEYDNIQHHHHHQMRQQQEGESRCRLFPSNGADLSYENIIN